MYSPTLICTSLPKLDSKWPQRGEHMQQKSKEWTLEGVDAVNGWKKRATTNLDRFAVWSHSEMLSREPKFARRWWWIGANAPLADERGTLERGDEQKKWRRRNEGNERGWGEEMNGWAIDALNKKSRLLLIRGSAKSDERGCGRCTPPCNRTRLRPIVMKSLPLWYHQQHKSLQIHSS